MGLLQAPQQQLQNQQQKLGLLQAPHQQKLGLLQAPQQQLQSQSLQQAAQQGMQNLPRRSNLLCACVCELCLFVLSMVPHICDTTLQKTHNISEVCLCNRLGRWMLKEP